MNLSTLTAKEVMRICHPYTDLEKRLFDIADELSQEINSVRGELDDAVAVIENDDSISADDFNDFVREVIALIKSGKTDDAINVLERGI